MCQKLKDLNGKKPDDFWSDLCDLPIDIFEILDRHEIASHQTSFKDLEKTWPLKDEKVMGMVFTQENDLTILYSKYSSMAEKRFTVAHELAHCCLHINADASFHVEFQIQRDFFELTNKRIRTINIRKEEEADKFARDLLIPTNALIAILENGKNITIKKLAKFFCVPMLQMRKKLEEIVNEEI